VGLFDDVKKLAGEAKDAVADHDEQVIDGIDKVADLVDDKTGGKHKDTIEKAAGKAKGAVEDLGRSQRPER
jgi:hypothetical protein